MLCGRLSTLRKCIIDLENSSKFATLYGLHSTALEFYFDELGELLRECCDRDVIIGSKVGGADGSSNSPSQKMLDEKKAEIRREIERVSLRRDALAILSTFEKAKGKGSGRLPNYNRLFQKLPTPFGSSQRKLKMAGVLLNLKREAGLFDPLNSLREFLKSEDDSQSATILAPLSHALKVPAGYVQARHLQEMFLKHSLNRDDHLPPFELSVKPIMVKLPQNDAAMLGEWCAGQYAVFGQFGKCVYDRLECLKLSRTFAQDSGNDELSKRIQRQLSALEDEILVREVLEGNGGRGSATNKLLKDLVDVIIGGWSVSGDFITTPQKIIARLLHECSKKVARTLVSQAGKDMDASVPFISMEDYRQAAWSVHSACALIGRQHGVNVSRVAKDMAQRIIEWGNYSGIDEVKDTAGDDEAYGEDDIYSLSQASSSGSGSDGEEVQMDLQLKRLTRTKTAKKSTLNVGEIYSVGEDDEEEEETEEEEGLILVEHSEERSILQKNERDKVELDDRRAGYEIAFLLSYSVGQFECSTKDKSEGRLSASDEREKQVKSTSTKLKKSTDYIGDHALGLLSAVFAIHSKNRRTGKDEPLPAAISSSTGDENDGRNSNLEKRKATVIGSDKVETSSFTASTFSAKHRAMQAAICLVPRDTLLDVKNTRMGLKRFDLDNLIFASRAARELEALHIPIPCESLVELSSLQFSSVARSIWRSHRSVGGRFLLLLVELCAREAAADSDRELLQIALEGVLKQKLPRSLLLCCEILIGSEIHPGKQLGGLKALTKELGKYLAVALGRSDDFAEVKNVVRRVNQLIFDLSCMDGGKGDWSDLARSLLRTAQKSGLVEEHRLFYLSSCVDTAKATSTTEERVQIWQDMAAIEGGRDALALKLSAGRKEKGETLAAFR